MGDQAIGGAGGNAGAGQMGGSGGIVQGSAIAVFGDTTTIAGSTLVGNLAIGGAGGAGGSGGGEGGYGGPIGGGALSRSAASP